MGHCPERQQAADDICAGRPMVGERAVDAGIGMSEPADAPNGA